MSGIKLVPDENDILLFRAEIEIKHDCPYKGGFFCLEIRCPNTYPNHTPTVAFKT